MDHVAIVPGHYDLRKKVYSTGVPIELIAEQYAGDYPWVMKYNDLSHDHEDDSGLDVA